MSTAVDIQIYNSEKLIKDLKSAGANDEPLLIKILEKCGHLCPEYYLVVNNEFYEDGNPVLVLEKLLRCYFDGDFEPALYGDYRFGITSVDLYKVKGDLEGR